VNLSGPADGLATVPGWLPPVGWPAPLEELASDRAAAGLAPPAVPDPVEPHPASRAHTEPSAPAETSQRDLVNITCSLPFPR
jgi:hypothetical protein